MDNFRRELVLYGPKKKKKKTQLPAVVSKSAAHIFFAASPKNVLVR
jgi:hypothetical protein